MNGEMSESGGVEVVDEPKWSGGGLEWEMSHSAGGEGSGRAEVGEAAGVAVAMVEVLVVKMVVM